MKGRLTTGIIGTVVASLVLAACGGGGGGGGTATPTQTPVFSRGIMQKGSVIVNGIRFDDSAANITADDTPKMPAFLKDGMMVKVKGKRNDDGVTGTAEKVQVENEVRGAIVSKGTDTFTVLGQTVQVSGATVFDNVANFAALNAGDVVEVHGLRDAAGVIQASRVEKITALGAVDELRGIVSGLTGTFAPGASFTINGFTITSTGSTTVSPAGSSIVNGTLVEVVLTGANTATRITVEDAADAEFVPAEGQEFEVEGYVSLFTGPSATFKVNDRVVSLSSSVRYENGLASDLGNGAKVEAEGHLNGGILLANKITFKENVRIEAVADGNGSPNVLGLTIIVASNADLSGLSGSISGILSGDRLRIRGFKNSDNSVTATRIESGGGGDPRLQGPVTNIVNTAGEKSFMILGIKIVTSGTTVARPNDDDGSSDQAISLSAFFSQLTDNRSVVKARGKFTAGSPSSIEATEVEIE